MFHVRRCGSHTLCQFGIKNNIYNHSRDIQNLRAMLLILIIPTLSGSDSIYQLSTRRIYI